MTLSCQTFFGKLVLLVCVSIFIRRYMAVADVQWQILHGRPVWEPRRHVAKYWLLVGLGPSLSFTHYCSGLLFGVIHILRHQFICHFGLPLPPSSSNVIRLQLTPLPDDDVITDGIRHLAPMVILF